MSRLSRRGVALFFPLLIIFMGSVSLYSGGFHSRILINLPALRLYLYEGEDVIEDFPIAIGHPETPTPTGSFHIVTQLIDPIWWPPDGRAPIYPGDENPLGSRWLGLNVKGYGIHGNNNPALIGETISLGCIRMYNEDVETLFSQVERGTMVDIIYQPVELVEGPGGWPGFLHHGDIYEQGVNSFSILTQLLLEEGMKEEIYLPALKKKVQEREGFGFLPQKVEILLEGFGEKFPGFKLGDVIWFPVALLQGEARVKMLENEKCKLLDGKAFVPLSFLEDSPYRFTYGEETRMLYGDLLPVEDMAIRGYNHFKK